MKSQEENSRKFHFYISGKKGNFNKAPLKVLFQNHRLVVSDLLVEIKFYIVSHHLPDDSDQFAGTMP